MKFSKTGPVHGCLKAPPSKSRMVRAVVAGILSEYPVEILGFHPCGDAVAALRAAVMMGKEVVTEGDRVVLKGERMLADNTEINCGESALTARLLIPVLSTTGKRIRITGERSLLRRPFDMAEGPMKAMGVTLSSAGGRLPITLQGPMVPGDVLVNGGITSQFLSGMLMALPVLNGDSRIRVEDLQSRPYVDLTLELLKEFQIQIFNNAYNEFIIPGRQTYGGAKIRMEGDWSGASFFMVLGALTGRVEIAGIRVDSVQGDKKILEALEKSGANIRIRGDTITVSKGRTRAFRMNAGDCPDLFPPLAALAAGGTGMSVISGVGRLIHKESSRGEAIVQEFGKIGIPVRIKEDDMLIEGGLIKGGKVRSHGDHRIAMSLIIASTVASGEVDIDDVACIDKSYPEFLNEYYRLTGKTGEGYTLPPDHPC